MRISTSQLYNQATRSILEGQSELAQIQNKLASGKQFTSLAEDPVGANRVVTLKRELAQLDMFQTNIDATRRRMELEETTLDALNIGLDRARELTIQAANGTLSDQDRVAISYELEQLVSYSASLMNTRDAKGEYIFSGSKGTTQTYQLGAGGSYSYQGDDTRRDIQVASAQYTQSSDTGQFLFESIQGLPSVSLLGADKNPSLENLLVEDGLNITDQVAFEQFFRTTGDLRFSVTEGTGDTLYYTLSDSSGNPINDTNGTPLEQIRYDGTNIDELSATLSLPGASLKVSLPASLTDDPAPIITGGDEADALQIDDPERFVDLIVNGVDGDPTTGSGLEIRTVDTGGGTYEYRVYSGGVELGAPDFSVTLTPPALPDNPYLLVLQDLSDPLTPVVLTADLYGDPAADTPVRTLDFEPAETVTLRFTQPPTNILNSLTDSLTAMRDLSSSDPEQRQALSERLALTLDHLTATQERLSESRASIGARLNAIDAAESSNLDFKLLTESTLSAVEDLDYASASTELARKQLALEAAFASFSKISGLSLFDYIQ